MATNIARRNPPKTLPALAATCFQSSPLRSSSVKLLHTFPGDGSKNSGNNPKCETAPHTSKRIAGTSIRFRKFFTFESPLERPIITKFNENNYYLHLIT